MGLEFGELPIRIRRIAYYGLSPLEQRVWAKSISHGIPNLLNRAIRVVLIVVPPFIAAAALHKWAVAAHDRHLRKDPKLYENDK